MSIVTERLNQNKPPQNTDPKTSKAVVNNNKDLDVDPKKDEPSFFGSFFTLETGSFLTSLEPFFGFVSVSPAASR